MPFVFIVVLVSFEKDRSCRIHFPIVGCSKKSDELKILSPYVRLRTLDLNLFSMRLEENVVMLQNESRKNVHNKMEDLLRL